jgi:hypothetical protein
MDIDLTIAHPSGDSLVNCNAMSSSTALASVTSLNSDNKCNTPHGQSYISSGV